MAESKSTPSQLPLPINGETIEIPLTQGQVTIVDAIDADLAEFDWTASYDGNNWYVLRHNLSNGNDITVRIHRVILSRVIGRPLLHHELVDHKDLNPLNNCRSNLRMCTFAENKRNTGIQANNTSGYKGVSWHKHSRRWRAQIKVNGKKIHIGTFDMPEAAHKAYCDAAKKHFGEFARFE